MPWAMLQSQGSRSHLKPMKRRVLFGGALAAIAASAARSWAADARPAPLSDRDRADLQRIETYLDGLKTLKARFIQVAPDGGTTSGTTWLARPGRMRFAYDPPTPIFLVAGHGLLVFRDERLKQTTNLPLGATPLGLLLEDHVKLSGDVTVTAISRPPGQIQVTLARTSSPGEGSLALVFSDPPLALRQWTVTDAQRRETHVSLFDIELGGSFDAKLFEYVDPQFLLPRRGG